MTRQEAEAVRRWGPTGSLLKNDHGTHMVGLWEGTDWVEKGFGDSWEAAFADADARSSR